MVKKKNVSWQDKFKSANKIHKINADIDTYKVKDWDAVPDSHKEREL